MARRTVGPTAVKAVDLVHAAAGTSASRYESGGALMLGAESDWGFFDFQDTLQAQRVSRAIS